jgi:hypothetical protein
MSAQRQVDLVFDRDFSLALSFINALACDLTLSFVAIDLVYQETFVPLNTALFQCQGLGSANC